MCRQIRQSTRGWKTRIVGDFNKYEVSKVSIALSFIYTMPFNITPVVDVSRIAHLKDAMIAMNIKLTKEEWYKLYLLGKHNLP